MDLQKTNCRRAAREGVVENAEVLKDTQPSIDSWINLHIPRADLRRSIQSYKSNHHESDHRRLLQKT
jgi:hypothetical protein